ncbi:MAG: CtsR family transcriptional regulator [Dethiobacteraceae bacterium]|jgi:transcriptional regulator CtsR|nr:CtsR family transcriptional regulator [Bacillota bacterium]
MSNLASSIELYIKRLLEASPNATLLLQRKELAERFQCVPSQINYVLSTRFTAERGYLVESRRGGGGYLRIRRLDLSRDQVLQIIEMLNELEEGVSDTEALDFVRRLMDARLITRREGHLMRAVLSPNWQDTAEGSAEMRTQMLVGMLEVLLRES